MPTLGHTASRLALALSGEDAKEVLTRLRAIS